MQSRAVTVIKQNLAGEETWRYSGRVIDRSPGKIVIEAYFNRPDIPFHGIILAQGDRFIETYYSDRWYNIFEIHDPHSGLLKGWYCNVTRPAVIGDSQISYVDLALDLLVFPDHSQLILDEDEFTLLPLSPKEREMALVALKELKILFSASSG